MLTYKLILFGLLLIFSTLLCAQFNDVGVSLGINNESSFSLNGSGISFYDFDHDGWDDITVATNGIPIKCYRNLQGTGFELFLTFSNDFTVKQTIWVDYDNDGDSDLFVTRAGASCILYRNDGNFQFTDVTYNFNLPSLLANSNGCSWADYDRDGWLDVFVCNYYEGEPSHSWLFHNNGDGTFTEKSIESGIFMGLKKSFQSTWFDYNMDGWLDLFVINTLYEGNYLYLNNGDGTFTDISLASGANYSVDAMCASACDFDKDNDFDIFISNSQMGNVLLEDHSGVFYNATNQSGVANTNNICWGSLWFDADNDFDQDLHVCSSMTVPGYFYQNNNDGTMTAASDPGFDLDYGSNYCNARGDFDNNGFYDVAVSRNAPADAGLFINTTSDNHWIKFGLTGTISNRDGVGALVKAYSDGECQVFHTHAGENYLSQNSAYNIVGLGANEALDSLIVNWPNGWVDKYTGLTSDSTYAFIEGETSSGMTDQVISLVMCPDSYLTLFAQSGESGTWYDGSQGDSMVVGDPGLYWVDVINIFGLNIRIYFDVFELDIPEFTIAPFEPTCPYLADGAIYFTSTESDPPEVYWPDLNSMDWSATGLPAGQYPCWITYGNGCSISLEIEVFSPDPLEVLFDIPIACNGSGVEVEPILSIDENEAQINWNGLNQEEVYSGEYEIYISYASVCIDTFSFTVHEADALIIEEEIIMPLDGDNGSIELNVTGGVPYYQFEWDYANESGSALYNIGQGTYECAVTDSLGCSASVQIELIDMSTSNDKLSDNLICSPNPFNTYLYITNNFGGFPIALYDMSGQKVDLNQSNNRIDTGFLSAGVYYLFSGTQVQKLVKL
jgi:hypothetical protein